MNYFAGQLGAPFHLSVGAIVFNDQHQIACRHLSHDEHGREADAYLLMRETLEPNETIETAIARGLKEEFGVQAELLDFLGPVLSHYGVRDRTVDKTTLFFICRFEKLVEGALNNFETAGPLEWHDVDFLVEKNRAQAKSLARDDIDDSLALERAKSWLAQ